MKFQFALVFYIFFILPLYGLCQTGDIEGIIVERATGKPLSEVSIRIDNDDKVGVVKTDQHAKTDRDGTFHFRELPTGTYKLSILHPFYTSIQISVEVVAGSTTDVKIEADEVFQLKKIAVRQKRFSPTVPRHDIRGSELVRLPGAFGDTLRGITTLPGIGIPNDFLGALYIRGSKPRDNLYYFDRVPLGFPYHYGGLVSTMSSSIIDEVHIYPSGYGTEFGLDSQAVVDIYSRNEIIEKWSGNFNVNFIYSEGVLERKIGDKGYAYVAGRRSYFDLIITHFIEEKVLFPRFWDYQLKFFYPFSEKYELTLNAFAAADYFDLTNVEVEEYLDFSAYLKNGFEGQGIHLRSQLTSKLTSHLSFTRSLSYVNVDFMRFANDLRISPRDGDQEEGEPSSIADIAGASILDLKVNVPVYMLREDAIYQVLPTFQIEPGFLLSFSPSNVFQHRKRPIYKNLTDEVRGLETAEVPEIDQWVETRETFAYQFNRAEGYFQGRYTSQSYWSGVLGIRFDYFNLTDQLSIQPRASLEFIMPTGTEMRFGYGHYEQSPRPYQMLSEEGNPDLRSSVAKHYSMELEHRFAEQTELKLAGFYKTEEKLVISRKKCFFGDCFDKYQFVLPGESAEYVNQGNGFVYGVEAFLRHRVNEKFFGWVSYAWTQDVLRQHISEPPWPYLFDNTHIVSIVANYNLTHNTEIGAKWQYSSGTGEVDASDMVLFQDPTTQGLHPLVNSISGTILSVELPKYHRLDVRVSRKQEVRNMLIGFFFEIVNLYNAGNIIKFRYSTGIEGTGAIQGIPGLPRFFSAGLTLEF